VEGRPVQARVFLKINPNNKISGDRRSRRTGRQVVHGVRIRRDPALPCRQDRPLPAEGHGQALRSDPVADDPARQASGRLFGQFTHFKMFAPKGNDYAFARYQSEVKRLYDVLEKRLGKSAFLGGEDFRSPTSRPSRGRAITTPTAVRFDDNPNLAAGSTPSPNGRRCSPCSQNSRPSSRAAITASDDDKGSLLRSRSLRLGPSIVTPTPVTHVSRISGAPHPGHNRETDQYQWNRPRQEDALQLQRNRPSSTVASSDEGIGSECAVHR